MNEEYSTAPPQGVRFMSFTDTNGGRLAEEDVGDADDGSDGVKAESVHHEDTEPMVIDSEMMDFMNFEDGKTEYTAMLFPPGAQEAVIEGMRFPSRTPQDEELLKERESQRQPRAWTQHEHYTLSYKEAQTQLANMKFGKVYTGDEMYEPIESSEDFIKLLAFGTQEDFKYKLDVSDLPLKSRVETQIKCRIVVTPAPLEHLIHLPTDTIARPKFQLQDGFVPSPNTLNLSVDVISQSSPQANIYICPRCMNREKKRAFRKKNLDPNEELHWSEDRPRRLAIFNCREVMSLSHPKACDLKGGQQIVQGKEIELPLRLACYCRHHSAKEGFKIVFTLRDFYGEIVGRTITKSIFITDDHKDVKTSMLSSASASASSNMMMNSSSSSLFSRHEPPPSPMSLESSEAFNSDHSSSYSSVFKRRRDDDWNGGGHSSMSRGIQPFQVQRIPSNKSISSANGRFDMPSPQSSDNAQILPLTQLQQQNSSSNSQVPQIQRIIPAQGSVRGGVEVTLLGTGFHPGLVTVFGESKSMSTQCWGESTIVTHLPAAATAGPVVVSFDGVVMSNPQIFTYIDDTDRQLIELALQVVGMKMNGKLEDARNIAMRIVQQDGDGDKKDEDAAGSASSSAAAPGSSKNAFSTSSSNDGGGHESVILRCIELVQVNVGKLPDWQLRNTEGQTMMHMAASLGYAQVVTTLLACGARLDLHDINGMTPLHFAALKGHRAIVERLLQHGANPFHKTNSGDTAMDIASADLSDVLPAEMSRREYVRYWMTRRNSSSYSITHPASPPLLEPYSSSSPHFDVWDESDDADQDSGYENEYEDLDSDDERLVQHHHIHHHDDGPESEVIIPTDATTSTNKISNYISQLSTSARNQWDSTWILNYIRKPWSAEDTTRAAQARTQSAVTPPEGSGGSDSDTTISPRSNNITRVWNYFMPLIPEDKAPPRYDEIFPDGVGSSSSQQHASLPPPALLDEKVEPRELAAAAAAAAAASCGEFTEQEYIAEWTKKRKQLKNDRMLFVFWLPVLFLLLAYFLFKYAGDIGLLDITKGFEWSAPAIFEELNGTVREFLAYCLLGRRNAPPAAQSTGLTVRNDDSAVILAPGAAAAPAA